MAFIAEVTCPGCTKTFQHEFALAPGTDLMQQEGAKMAQEAKLIHDHLDEVRRVVEANQANLQPVDVAGPIADALAPLDRRMEAIQQGVSGLAAHQTPAQAVEHWKACPTCGPEYQQMLKDIAPPPVAVAVAAAAPPKPAPLNRKAYPDVIDVPESRFVRESYGVKTVEQDGKHYVQAESEKAAEEAIEAGVVEKGCEFKCDETGCWWLCEKQPVTL